MNTGATSPNDAIQSGCPGDVIMRMCVRARADENLKMRRCRSKTESQQQAPATLLTRLTTIGFITWSSILPAVAHDLGRKTDLLFDALEKKK